MQVEHFDATLDAFVKRSPFQPFIAVLINGDRFEVDHRTAIVFRDGVAVYIGPGGVPIIFDHEGVNQFIGDLLNRGND